jgi:hypothetical protein
MRAVNFISLWIVLSCTNEVTIAVIDDVPGGSAGKGGWTAGAWSAGGVSMGTGGGPTTGGVQGKAGDWTIATGGTFITGNGGSTIGGAAGGVGAGGHAAGGANQLTACESGLIGDGATPLIDDFNDGDLKPLMQDGRSGSYAFAGDQSPEATNNCRVTDGELRLEGKQYGAKSGWGASFGLLFDGIPGGCRYYNASRYAGVTFRAKGTVSQELWIQISTAQVIPVSAGGLCSDESMCLNKHRARITLGPEYRAYNIYWNEFVQDQWGIRVSFSPDMISTIEFAFPQLATDGMEVDFDVSIDDLAFSSITK